MPLKIRGKSRKRKEAQLTERWICRWLSLEWFRRGATRCSCSPGARAGAIAGAWNKQLFWACSAGPQSSDRQIGIHVELRIASADDNLRPPVAIPQVNATEPQLV